MDPPNSIYSSILSTSCGNRPLDPAQRSAAWQQVDDKAEQAVLAHTSAELRSFFTQEAVEKLAKYTYATHIKDLKITPNVAADEWFFFSCVAVGDGYVNVKDLAKILKENDYTGMLAVELDFPHPDVGTGEDAAVEKSIKYLREVVADL